MGWLSRSVLIVGMAGVLAACAAGTTWKKPGSSPAKARAALAECRSRTNIEVEDRYGSEINGGSGGIGDEFRSSVARNDAVRLLDRKVAECMAGKGYSR